MAHTRSLCTFLLVALVLLIGLLPGVATPQTQVPPPSSPPPPSSGANQSGGPQATPGSSAPAADQSDESALTLMVLQTSFLTVSIPPDDSCASYVPDYKKYHSILEIVDTERLGVTREGGSMPAGLPIYKANSAGRDPISGEDRRMGLGSGSFDPLAGTVVLRSLVGEPGTRTFRGDASHPFAPVPGISAWEGAVDIDPKCGIMIHARSADVPASTKSDLASKTLLAQRPLKVLGYPGPADDKAGARTVEAIKNFERSEKLPVDGRVSPALLKVLEARQSKIAKDQQNQ